MNTETSGYQKGRSPLMVDMSDIPAGMVERMITAVQDELLARALTAECERGDG